MSDAISVQLLVKELKDVVDNWKPVGVSLGVPVRKLDTIKLDDPHGGVENWKIKMFQLWLQYKADVSWKDVVQALKENDYPVLAAKLKTKYLLTDSSTDQVGAAAIPPPADDPLNKPPKMKELLNKVASRAMNKWKRIGRELEIEQHQLNSITNQDAIECYADVFDLWQKRANPPFTWATILEALRSSVVDEKALAHEIEDWLRATC